MHDRSRGELTRARRPCNQQDREQEQEQEREQEQEDECPSSTPRLREARQ